MKWTTVSLLTALCVLGCDGEQPRQGRYRMLRADPTTVWVLDTQTGTLCIQVFAGGLKRRDIGPLVAWCKPWPGDTAEDDADALAAKVAAECARCDERRTAGRGCIIDNLPDSGREPNRSR